MVSPFQLPPISSGTGTNNCKRSEARGQMERQLFLTTSICNGCGLFNKNSQISARRLGLRDLVLQVEDLRFRFTSATTQRLKISLYTVVRRGSTAVVHCLLPRFYRGCPRFCYSGLDRSSPVFIRDFSFPAPTGLLPLLRDFSRYCGTPPRSSPSPRRRIHFRRGVLRRKNSPF